MMDFDRDQEELAASRPEFEVAWDLLQEPVRKAVELSDGSAVLVTLLRFAIHLHMQGTGTAGTSAAKSLFDDLVRVSYQQTVQDYADAASRS